MAINKQQSFLPFKVRDKRKEHRYYVDNEFLNGYAKMVGWHGQVVYHALCRHAKNETCFPSLQHMAIELGVSLMSVRRGIDKLKEFNLIEVVRRGKTQSNEYYLKDRTEWGPVAGWSNQSKKDKPFRNIPHKP